MSPEFSIGSIVLILLVASIVAMASRRVIVGRTWMGAALFGVLIAATDPAPARCCPVLHDSPARVRGGGVAEDAARLSFGAAPILAGNVPRRCAAAPTPR